MVNQTKQSSNYFYNFFLQSKTCEIWLKFIKKNSSFLISSPYSHSNTRRCEKCWSLKNDCLQAVDFIHSGKQEKHGESWEWYGTLSEEERSFLCGKMKETFQKSVWNPHNPNEVHAILCDKRENSYRNLCDQVK
jgi:hypothetical protein